MKKLKAVIGVLAMSFAMLFVSSCKDKSANGDSDLKSENHSDMGHDHKEPSKKEDRLMAVNTQKKTASTPIIEAYIQVKNGLVADSKEAAAKGGEALVAAFSKLDMTSLQEESHKEYMEIMESAKEHAEHIVKSDINHQREHFNGLSIDVNDLIALVGTEKILYQDYCPMADNNKGAYWFSEDEAINNPYFGAKMLKCGSLKKQIN